jgi:hypothetical protein
MLVVLRETTYIVLIDTSIITQIYLLLHYIVIYIIHSYPRGEGVV